MKVVTQSNNFVYLFWALVALLFSASLVQELSGTWGEEIFSFVILAMLILSIKSVRTDFAWKKIFYLLSLVFFILIVIAKFIHVSFLPNLTLLLMMIFFIGSFWAAYKQILFEGHVDGNKVIGSISLYLLLGLVWTIIYLLLLQIDPTAFSGIEEGNWKQNFSQVAYYSFVTLTTLGYGDILPVNRVAQFFVYMETIMGVFYMAIIVSSLISLRLAKLQEEKE